MSTKNYITPHGAEKLKAELRHLRDVERPEVVRVVSWAAGNGDRSENADYIYGKRRLREIDKRIHYLTERLSLIEIVEPEKQKASTVFFGATVIVENAEGLRKTISIVGVDETDIFRNRVSWLSPIGKALLKKSKGDVAVFETPGGTEELEILEIKYLPLD